MIKKILGQIPKHAALILLCVFAVFPIYWMATTAFKPLGEIFLPTFLPASPTLDNFGRALEGIPLLQMTFNSAAIAVLHATFQLTTGVLASYALTRWNFRGRTAIFIIFSLTWLIPIQAIMIPNYVTIVSMGLRNTILGAALPFAASSFAILSLYSAFRSFPKALIEAAVMDGLSEWNILLRIVLPNLKAALVSLGILLFINGWNEYVWSLLVNSNLNQAPIQIGLQQFQAAEGNEWGAMMAAATLASLPILALYLLLQKKIINSFVKWGIK